MSTQIRMTDKEILEARMPIKNCDDRLTVDFFGAVFWRGEEVDRICQKDDPEMTAKTIARQCEHLDLVPNSTPVKNRLNRLRLLVDLADGLETPRAALFMHPAGDGMRWAVEGVTELYADEIELQFRELEFKYAQFWRPEHPTCASHLVVNSQGAEHTLLSVGALHDWARQYFGTSTGSYTDESKVQLMAAIKNEFDGRAFACRDALAERVFSRGHANLIRQRQ